MSRPVTLELTGVADLQKRLNDLNVKSGSKIARSVLGAGLNVAKREIRKLAPAKWLKEAIGSRNERNRRKNFHEAKVGVNVGKRTRTKARQWAPVAVLGTIQRRRQSIGGKFAYITKPTDQQLSTGRNKENQIVRQGYANAQGKMDSVMRKAFDKLLAKELAKHQLNRG